MSDFNERLGKLLTESKEIDHVGFFIRLPKELANQYPKDMDKDGDTSDPHITLLYIGTAKASDIKKIKEIGKEVINKHKKTEAFIGGLAYFTSPELEIAHSIVECKGLSKLNKDLWDSLLEAGVPVDHKYPEYTPHVTLACIPKRDYDGPTPSGSFMVKEIELWKGKGKKAASFRLK